MKIALIGIIRNEAYDILSWLAWHALLGVDTFIIFDDDSDDGTRALLEAASLHWDIRLFHVTETAISSGPQSYLHRQARLYCDALLGVKDHFDWVGIFDSDEYVALYQHKNLHDFLSEMGPDVGAVGLNWRLYGANHLISTPNMPTVHAFSRHTLPSLPINHHIKSFIRPSYWQGSWVNAHYFPLSQGHYVSAAHQPIEWSATAGIAATPADWSVAALMHFQNRSLEHFVKRTCERTDINLLLTGEQIDQINHWDDLEDLSPREKTPQLLHSMRSVVLTGMIRALAELGHYRPAEKGLTPPSPIGAPAHFHIFALRNHDNLPLGTKNTLAHTVLGPHTDSDGTRLYLLQSQHLREAGFIFALDGQGHISDVFILDDSRLTGLLHYDVFPVQQLQQIALRRRGGINRKKAYLSAPPEDALIANRTSIDIWEYFKGGPASTTPSGASWLTIPALQFAEMALQEPVTLERITALAHIDYWATCWLLPLLAAHLAEPQRRELHSYLGPFAPFCL